MYAMDSIQRKARYLQFLIEEILYVTEKTMNASASSLFLLDQDKQELCFQFISGPVKGLLKEATLGTESGIAGWVAQHGEPLIVNNVREDQRFCEDIDEITGFVTNSILCVPLAVRDRVLGVIEVLNKADGSDFIEQDLHTLKAVAATAAVAIELKLAEDKIQASEARYLELLGSLSDRDSSLFDLAAPSKAELVRHNDKYISTNIHVGQRNG